MLCFKCYGSNGYKHAQKEVTNVVEFTCELLTFEGYTGIDQGSRTDNGMWLAT